MSTRVQPHIIQRDSGGIDLEWRCRGFQIEISLTPGNQHVEGIYIKDLVTGYEIEWDEEEGVTHGHA